MMSSTPLIIVGAGKWGTTLISVILNLTSDIIVVDSNLEALSRVKSDHTAISTYASLSEALSFCALLNHRTKAPVVIATPTTTHFDLARRCIVNGHSVLVEKPMCTTAVQAEELVKLADKHQVVLMVDHVMQYNFSYRRMIQMVKEGAIGNVYRIKMVRCNTGTVRLTENVLWSFLPHEMSILLSLTGSSNDPKKAPDKVTCHGQSFVTKGIEDYVNIHLSFKNGAQAHLEASWLHPKKERRTVVYGESGSLILNEIFPSDETLEWITWDIRKNPQSIVVQKIQKKVPDDNNSEIEMLRKERKGRTLEYVVEEFLRCVKEAEEGISRKPRTDGREAFHGIRILEAATESLKHNGATISLTMLNGADGYIPKPTI